jgi:hypothetical protein
LATNAHTLRSSASNPGLDAFHDARSLEFRDRPQDVHLELAGGRCGVDPLGERHEGHSERVQVVQERYQVLQISAKAIEPPTHQHVESAPFSRDDQPI